MPPMPSFHTPFINTKPLKAVPFPWNSYITMWTYPDKIKQPTSIHWQEGVNTPTVIITSHQNLYQPERRPLPNHHVPDDINIEQSMYLLQIDPPILVFDGLHTYEQLHYKVMSTIPMPFPSALQLAEVFGFSKEHNTRTASQIIDDLRDRPVDNWIWTHIYLVANMMVEYSFKSKKLKLDLFDNLPPPINQTLFDVVRMTYDKWFAKLDVITPNGTRQPVYSSSGLHKIIRAMQLFNPSWASPLRSYERMIR
jgi:hypothetical protein